MNIRALRARYIGTRKPTGLRSWWSRLPPIHRFAIKAIGGAYVIIFLFAALVTKFGASIAFPKGHFFDAENIDAFTISLWASISFFTVIGIASLLISVKRPEHDIIENRIWYLFSSKNATDGARKYVAERLHKFAAFASHGSIEFVVKEFNDQIGAFRVEVHNTFYLENMLPYEVYCDNGSELELWGDPIARPPDGKLGELWLAQVIQDGVPHDLIDDKIVIDPEHQRFIKKNLAISIEPSDAVTYTYKYKYWVWALSTESIVTNVNRYSDNIDISVYNGMSSTPLSYGIDGEGHSYNMPSKNDSAATRTSSDNIVIRHGLTLTPEIPFGIRFFLQPGQEGGQSAAS